MILVEVEKATGGIYVVYNKANHKHIGSYKKSTTNDGWGRKLLWMYKGEEKVTVNKNFETLEKMFKFADWVPVVAEKK